MFDIKFMDPHVIWVWVPIVAVLGGAFAWYNLRTLDGARKLWGDYVFLKQFSPRNSAQGFSLWVQWVSLILVLVFALAGPHISQAPDMVPAGAVQVEFVYDVSPSMAAEDYRPYLPAPEGGRKPDNAYQWGTRLDAAKYFTTQLLTQVAGNEAGLVTMMGSGYNMWDITTDLSPHGAFNVMLQKFVQVFSAPGGGANFTSGFQTALDEFDLTSAIEKRLGDTTDKVKFIVLFTDGGFTGDKAELNKVLAELNKRHVRLLIVALGGTTAVSVPKYDDSTKRRTPNYYDGTTAVDLSFLKEMQKSVPGSDLIAAPPGTDRIDYSFPQKAGGLHATAQQSNLRVWLLLAAFLLFASITTGGGGLPRWKFLKSEIRLATIKTAIASLKSKSVKPTK